MTMVGGTVEYCADGMQALCPQNPATAAPTSAADASDALPFRDDFDGALAPGWTWLREDPSAWSLTAVPGWLRIGLSTEGFLSGAPTNVLLRPAPQGDFDLRTRLQVAPTQDFEFAGLIVAFDDDSVLQFGHGYCDLGPCVGEGYYFDNLQDGAVVGANFGTPSDGPGKDGLRLVRQGNTYIGYYLADDATWIEVGRHVVDRPPLSVGLTADQAPSPGPTAEFDTFEITAP
jgi:hypothetical protein